MSKFRILSIDGGGIRGIIPALFLKELEKHTKKPIAQCFDLIAGTSTGGILALILNVPDRNNKPKYTAKDVVNLYINEGKNIFSRSIFHRIRAVGNLAEEKYPSSGIEKVLKHYLGKTRLKDAITPVFVTSYAIERRMPFFFRSERSKANPTYDFSMAEVARSTSAAPTYFEPAKLPGENKDYYALIDGGVFANNPTMCAVVEALAEHKAKEIKVVSLGTGELTRPIHYNDAKSWGLAGWAQPLLNVIFDGVSDTVQYQVEHIVKSLKNSSYDRFQCRLNEGNDDMDDTSNTNLRALRFLAEDMIRKNNSKIKKIAKQLIE